MVAPAKNPSTARCQCDPACKSPPLNNSPFCANHEKSCPRKSPLSGAEPKYEPELYNNHNGIKEAQNCFAYAFDYKHLPDNCTKNSCPMSFIQPGLKSGYPKWSNVHGKRCPDLKARLFGDVPDIKETTFEDKCPAGYSKIALVVDEDEDYHFYRMDSNGDWSHKPGATDVTNKDATGRRIYDPKLASRKYSHTGLDYDGFCGYLCVPRNTELSFKRGGFKRGAFKSGAFKSGALKGGAYKRGGSRKKHRRMTRKTRKPTKTRKATKATKPRK